MITDGLDALYLQVRKIQIATDGSPRFNSALVISAVLYPVVSAGFVFLFGPPLRPEFASTVPSYFALPPLLLIAFLVSVALAAYFFDRRRDDIERKFVGMPTYSSVEGMLSLVAVLVIVITVEGVFVTSFPLISLLAFAIFLVVSGLIARRWLGVQN